MLSRKLEKVEDKLDRHIKTNKILLSKFVDMDLFMDSDIKFNLNDTINLITQRQKELSSEVLSLTEAKVLRNLVGSLNDEVDSLQLMLAEACCTLNQLAKQKDETADRVNSLEKLVIELKREIEQYWGGQRRINDVDIDSLHTKNTSLKAQLEYSDRWRLTLEKALSKQMHKNKILEEMNQTLHQTTEELILKNQQIASKANINIKKDELKRLSEKIDPENLRKLAEANMSNINFSKSYPIELDIVQFQKDFSSRNNDSESYLIERPDYENALKKKDIKF